MPVDPITFTTGAATAAGAWLWDKYGKEFIDKLGEHAKGGRAK